MMPIPVLHDRHHAASKCTFRTVVADAGMFSAANKQDIINAGMHYILGSRFKDIPKPIAQWRTEHPDQAYVDGQIWEEVDPRAYSPSGLVAGANRHDSLLLRPTLDQLDRSGFNLPDEITVHLDAGYDSKKTRSLLEELGCGWVISTKGEPLQAGPGGW